MLRYQRRLRLFAACLAAVAGYVDATGFLIAGGFFVSFMSGNTTRFGVGVASQASAAWFAGAIIALFVIGVVIGTLIGRRAGRHQPMAVLSCVALLLGLAATLEGLGMTGMAVMTMAAAMGAENAVFERDGEVSIGLTYMTGTLVKCGQRLAAALAGGQRWAWLPYFMLWAAMAGGALAGALTWPRIGLWGLWGAAGAVALLATLIGDARPIKGED